MLDAYVPLLILVVVSILNAVGMVVASHFLGPIRPTPAKRSAYESGMVPLGNARERFSVKFYMVAILFIVFDLETVFLIPWAVAFRSLGVFGFVEMLIFIGVLLVGLVYVWKKGALQWE
jgi:NADH-quinone oxidoreductase subunit A